MVFINSCSFNFNSVFHLRSDITCVLVDKRVLVGVQYGPLSKDFSDFNFVVLGSQSDVRVTSRYSITPSIADHLSELSYLTKLHPPLSLCTAFIKTSYVYFYHLSVRHVSGIHFSNRVSGWVYWTS